MNKLFRSRYNSKLTGLSGGLAEWTGISATLIRLIWIISAFCSFGTTILVYFIASLVIPKEPPAHSYDYDHGHGHGPRHRYY
ncbi:phage shock protein C (PspC) family protein [Paenibacillus sp. UNCCL117]|uniref:PspC domain-containing protein n=1 Tax=unclassified Paenibacillus TaxID=185978 RepID=UPI000887AD9E|nr:MULTISPECIES: PspC domain-containing protein [unclassified Paenibacillus]SDD12615.1 Phage shock protein PspC (stress-responsive transcriptional regulator) [Paenibacillus sp. cl123]SFW33825.1 phage shock protein C (PspC) family protein [Paenibacillus sp. UNCCL117]